MPKDEQVQSDGAGKLIERRYWVEVQGSQRSIQELMADIQLNIADYAPGLLADFEKSKGSTGTLRPGDEFAIKILGPWNGDVRVTDVSDTHFELRTLEGHPEAGDIRFFIEPLEHFPDAFHFEIRSLARSRDGLVSFAYDTVGVGKKMQEQTWVAFCERVAEQSGGEKIGDVQVRTLYEEDLHPVVKAEAE
ncbi:protein of unknown function [Deinococcus reticulitermitis]|uniref:DUF1990 domain-containing protein n=1 Tax=Deinococcus reticulitermitis TaxID=856736 RepID=A0A1H6Z6I1_9DEIO|nr:DUF1990 family protein [Deinococcus reticulitermitis]SEJ48316.1 protein of unknown function [Deinococcus reticulitermitis]